MQKGKKMSKVVTHNDFNLICSRDMTLQEHRVMVTAISQINDKGTDTITMNYRDFCRLANINPKNVNQAQLAIRRTMRKLSELRTIKEDEDEWTDAPLFKYLSIKKKTGQIEIQINERAEPLFNNLSTQFTVFELEEHNSFNSSYSTVAFRNLMQFKSTGRWRVSVTNFRKLLDIPESYTMATITRRVLKPIEEEMTEYFDGHFEIKKIAGKSDGKPGRRPITTLEFLFTPKKTNKKPPKDVTPTPIWKRDWYLAMTKEEQSQFESYCRQKKLKKDELQMEQLGTLIAMGAYPQEIDLALLYIENQDGKSFDGMLETIRKRTGKTGKQEEKKNTPPPADAPYSDGAIADNLPF
jgi:plasmid replication initiation protein